MKPPPKITSQLPEMEEDPVSLRASNQSQLARRFSISHVNGIFAKLDDLPLYSLKDLLADLDRLPEYVSVNRTLTKTQHRSVKVLCPGDPAKIVMDQTVPYVPRPNEFGPVCVHAQVSKTMWYGKQIYFMSRVHMGASRYYVFSDEEETLFRVMRGPGLTNPLGIIFRNGSTAMANFRQLALAKSHESRVPKFGLLYCMTSMPFRDYLHDGGAWRIHEAQGGGGGGGPLKRVRVTLDGNEMFDGNLADVQVAMILASLKRICNF